MCGKCPLPGSPGVSVDKSPYHLPVMYSDGARTGDPVGHYYPRQTMPSDTLPTVKQEKFVVPEPPDTLDEFPALTPSDALHDMIDTLDSFEPDVRLRLLQTVVMHYTGLSMVDDGQ